MKKSKNMAVWLSIIAQFAVAGKKCSKTVHLHMQKRA
jgi:hypothetical protein